MDKQVQKYLSMIGQKGGQKSRRTLSPELARQMVKLREAKRAFKKYYAHCFWSYSPHYSIQLKDIPWIANELKKHGSRKAFILGCKLCR